MSPAPARVLLVCTANICRSPMAELLLDEYLARQGSHAPVDVSSAGTRARPGQPASTGMQRVAQAWGLDLGSHRSRRVELDLVAEQDLVLTMEHAHRTAVARLGAGLGQRTFTITELTALAERTTVPAAAALSTRVATWHEARPRIAVEADDVADPYGGPDEGYERTAWQLADLIEVLTPHLAVAAAQAPTTPAPPTPPVPPPVDAGGQE